MTRPNGSSHSIGKSVARAFWSRATFLAWLVLAEVLDAPAEVRRHVGLEVVLLGGLRIFPAILSGNPASCATSTARWQPLSALIRPRKRR